MNYFRESIFTEAYLKIYDYIVIYLHIPHKRMNFVI